MRRLIAQNAAAARYGRPRLPCPLSDTPGAVFMRMRRWVGRRRAEYDGVPYHERMASDPLVIAEALRVLGWSAPPVHVRAR